MVSCSNNPRVVVLQVAPSCFFCFFKRDELVDVIFPSFLWSSCSSACFCSNAESRVPCCCCFVHLDSGCAAILIASLHVIFLCVSIQHGMLAAFCPLRLVCFFSCFRYFLHLQLLPCPCRHLSRSGKIRRCLDRILCSCCFLHRCRLSYVVDFFHLQLILCRLLILFHSFDHHHLNFLVFHLVPFFVCTMRQSILRCVDRISFSCTCESVHVPDADVSVGVMTMLNKRSLCRRRYDLDVNSFVLGK